MRPDSSDIALRNRSRGLRREKKSRSRPLQPRFKSSIYTAAFFLFLAIILLAKGCSHVVPSYHLLAKKILA